MKNLKYKKQKGVVLFIVLMAVTLLVILAANFVVITNRNSVAVESFNYNKQAKYTAFAGIQYAMFAMRDPVQETRWKTDGRLYQVNIDEGTVYVKIMPESGLIDMNRSSKLMLVRLFEGIGLEKEVAEDLADNVIFWRGRSQTGLSDAATDDDYLAAGLPVPEHRSFYAIEEVARVFGITPEIYTRIKPLITINGSSKVSIYYAGSDVLRILGLTDEEISAVQQARLEYYDTDVSIDSSIIEPNNFLTFAKNGVFYRILSYAVQNDGGESSLYSVIRKKVKSNGAYLEIERGVLQGTMRDDFLSQINSLSQERAE